MLPPLATLPPSLVFVLDTETTGLSGRSDTRCLQLGAVAYDRQTQAMVSEFVMLMAPDVWGEQAEDAVRVHGITREYAEAHGVSQLQGWEAWVQWLADVSDRGEYRGGPHVLAAWNAAFDSAIVREWGQRVRPSNGVMPPWPTWAVAKQYAARQGCLMKAYGDWMQAHNVKGSRKLTEASQRFGLGSQEDIHDALKDAKRAADVWRAMEKAG